jgi:hypothetical protein
MKKWSKELNRVFSKKRSQNGKKTKLKHEEVLNIPGNKGNANQNHTKIQLHSC